MPNRIALVWVALALARCGLLDPPAPPARTVGAVPGAAGDGAPQAGDGGAGEPPLPGYRLAWHDEFDGSALDQRSWTIDVGPWRDGLNAADAVEVGGGALSLITFTDAAGVHHSGHVQTGGKFEARYGYYEARVRFGESAGQWCSFFAYTSTIGHPVGDPGNAGVEVDVFEHRQADDSGWEMEDLIQVGINWDGFGAFWKRDNRLVGAPDGSPLVGAWHVYSVLWTADGYVFYVDGAPVFHTSKAVSHVPEPLYLTCEVENGGWAGYVPPGGYGSRATSRTRMDVDWVRVWVPSDDPAAR